jgi:hypothetical protein
MARDDDVIIAARTTATTPLVPQDDHVPIGNNFILLHSSKQ